jgi:hypothetical protein
MAGGIQKGTQAGSKASKKLDRNLRKVSEAIAQALEAQNKPGSPYFERGHENLVAARWTQEKKDRAALPELAQLGITVGCVPDGGMWFDGDRSKPDRKLLAVFEAKHQQDGGNAIERWCKNHMFSKCISPDMTYHTVMSGEGAKPGGVLDKFANSITAAEGSSCVFHKKPEGFSEEEIFDIMKDPLKLDDMTFNDIQPYLNTKLSRFLDLFEEQPSPEELVAEMLIKQQFNTVDEQFVEILQDRRSPLTQAWLRVARDDKAEAKDLAIDMLIKGHSAQDIAEAFESDFTLTVNPRLNT